MEKVRSELLIAYQLIQLSIRRGNDPYINRNLLIFTHAENAAFL